MLNHIEEDNTFTGLTTLAGLAQTFDNCKFIDCELPAADLSNITFIDCKFEGCNLERSVVFKTGFQGAFLKDCNVNGIDFSKASDFLFGMSFEGCTLNNAILYKKKNKRARFTDCSLKEADLTECDLTDAIFTNCDMHRTVFSYTILKNADLRTSYNYIIDPDENTLKKARFSVHGLPGLLAKYDIRIEG